MEGRQPSYCLTRYRFLPESTPRPSFLLAACDLIQLHTELCQTPTTINADGFLLSHWHTWIPAMTPRGLIISVGEKIKG